MAYLVAADYNSLITTTNLDQIIESDVQNRLDAELIAEEEIFSYIGSKYNLTTEFAKTGTARNRKLVQVYIDISLYHLHARINPRNIPELRNIRYDGNGVSPPPPSSATGWLMGLNSDDLTTNLVRIADDVGNSIKFVGEVPIDTEI